MADAPKRRSSARKTTASRKKRTSAATSSAPRKKSTGTARKKSTGTARKKSAGTARKKSAGTARKKTAKKKVGTRKYSPAAARKVGTVMHEMHEGSLRSGRSGKKVTNPKQAVAIGLSEARRSGAKVPSKPRSR